MQLPRESYHIHVKPRRRCEGNLADSCNHMPDQNPLGAQAPKQRKVRSVDVCCLAWPSNFRNVLCLQLLGKLLQIFVSSVQVIVEEEPELSFWRGWVLVLNSYGTELRHVAVFLGAAQHALNSDELWDEA